MLQSKDHLLHQPFRPILTARLTDGGGAGDDGGLNLQVDCQKFGFQMCAEVFRQPQADRGVSERHVEVQTPQHVTSVCRG